MLFYSADLDFWFIKKARPELYFTGEDSFPKYSTKQVSLTAHTPEQMMKNKITAAIDRREIRDCFDIEFLLRIGAPFSSSAHPNSSHPINNPRCSNRVST
jgi:hypothetical protein